ncbi:alpha beta-hydrolase [Coniophora puteana RWD-64-598 SS2]|uniref:Carboxylic ester hydrolase n=1 Tax=Coniophora puteana (strain RWD-64-598) TaxID=741705 RepID=A0A5M3MQ91_CONPW|nr:alpha beta-hydrolase [Coniophora puteana RWD-64-598 SS2]EIW81227.1 alpha beta-hydrolase [Coniophora puteana RWD-64-598 SS2]
MLDISPLSRIWLGASVLGVLAPVVLSQSLGYDVVIVSNNDLNPSNPNRASALLLNGALTCAEAQSACSGLMESLLPAPNSTAGLTTANLTSTLISDRHGAALGSSENLWIAGSDGCAVFSLSSSESETGSTLTPNQSLPALCTNSAPLTRSNVTSYDTTRQIEVSTNTAGILRGFRDKFVWRFLGIKYAEDPSGDARFLPPTPLNVSANTTRDATQYLERCAQPPDADNGHTLYGYEDCLQLNVYSPVVASNEGHDDTAPKMPVMFFIHGGGLNTGDSGPFPFNETSELGYVGNSTSNVYDGTNLASYGGVVVVTINYRLSALGWFNASNAALKDALLALHWVQDNIEAFGGDPTRVLIYGESAGGTMTRYLLGTNPAYTQGLFSAAILESDFGTSNPFFSPELALNQSLGLARYLGCASNSSTTLTEEAVSCVRNTSAGDIVMASYNLNLAWSITVDGDYVLNVIKDSILDSDYSRVPTIWATNQCEYCYFLPTSLSPDSPPSAYAEYLPMYFNSTAIDLILNQTTLYPYETATSSHNISGTVLTLGQLMTDYYVHCPSTYLASLETNTTNPGNAYKILFGVGLGNPMTANPATCPGQVCHADELYWVFGTAETDNVYQPLTEQQVWTTQEVIKRWTSLAWDGNPNYEGALVEWPPYTGDNELVLNTTETLQPYHVAQCDFIDSQLGLIFGDGTY